MTEATDIVRGQPRAGARHAPRRAISVVTMMYRSEPFLSAFLEQARQALAEARFDDHEIVFVNDGSPDGSAAFVRAQQALDPRVRLVDLARNFGHHRAALAGLTCARGDLVFMIDCDLEVPPSVLGTFLRTMRDTSADVVYGVQEVRKGGLVERVGGRVFWRLFNLLSDTRVPENVLTERLMRREYVDALLQLGDRNIFLAGMMYWTGFRQVGVPVAKSQREGRSTYSLRKRVSLLVEAITSFSTVPLKFVLGVGLLLVLAAVLFGAFLVARKLLYPDSVLAGFTALSLLIIGSSGVVITMMGILGLYVSRIFVQTQGRPAFIVRNLDEQGQEHEREP